MFDNCSTHALRAPRVELGAGQGAVGWVTCLDAAPPDVSRTPAVSPFSVFTAQVVDRL